MIKVGITGGIGSGKSYVCSILEQLGFPVFYSDKVSKELLNSDEKVRSQLTSLFGDKIYHNNDLDKAQLSKLIFSDSTLLQKVNAIVHPRVRDMFHQWSLKQKSPIVFNEAAILFETGAYKFFDATILITSPSDLRIQRVMNRDGVSENDVVNRMNNQWSDEDKKVLATYCIVNDEKQGLISQIEEILSKLFVLEKNKN